MTGELLLKRWGGRHTERLEVAAVSCWNGLASNPYHLWALRRAELTAFTYSPFRNAEGNPVVMGQVRQLDPRSFGGDRMAELLGLGLRELFPALDKLPPEARIGAVLALPERMSRERASARDRRARERLERTLTDGLRSRGLDPTVRSEAGGHAAGVRAAIQVAEALLSGEVEVGLIGGIDSAYDPAVVEVLLAQDRLLDTGHLDAMVPGEGVALALVTRTSLARQRGLSPMVSLEAAALNHEPATFENDVGLLGLGLSRAAVAVGQRLREDDRRLDWWLTDLTPESFRVQEFQLAWPRAARELMTPESFLEHLPHHLGDLGAATVPTGVALATEASLRGDPPARTCLLTASSDGGDRGVLLLGE